MYQIGSIISFNDNRKHIKSALNVQFIENKATYGPYQINVYGGYVVILCNEIHSTIQVKNFVNRISRILLADDSDVDRTIKLLVPNYYTIENDYAETDSEDSDSDDDY